MTFIRTCCLRLAYLYCASGLSLKGSGPNSGLPEPAEELLGARRAARCTVLRLAPDEADRMCMNRSGATMGEKKPMRSPRITYRYRVTRARLRVRRLRAAAIGPSGWVRSTMLGIRSRDDNGKPSHRCAKRGSPWR